VLLGTPCFGCYETSFFLLNALFFSSPAARCLESFRNGRYFASLPSKFFFGPRRGEHDDLFFFPVASL